MPEGEFIGQFGGQRPEEQDAIAVAAATQRALEDALRQVVQTRGPEYLDAFEQSHRGRIKADYSAIPGVPAELSDMRQRMHDAAVKAVVSAVDAVRKNPAGGP